MSHDYCLNCGNADVDMDEDSIRIFCQVRMSMIADITEAFLCDDFVDRSRRNVQGVDITLN